MPSLEKPKDYTLFLIAALLGGGGSSLGWNIAKDPRPDPFTGAEGRSMEQRHIKRISALEHEVTDLRFQLGKESRAMSDVRQLTFRVQLIEGRLNATP